MADELQESDLFPAWGDKVELGYGLYECPLCGSAVVSTGVHTKWHNDQRKDAPPPGLAGAVEAVVQAWTDPGPVPEYHAMVKEGTRKRWPALTDALDKLEREARGGN